MKIRQTDSSQADYNAVNAIWNAAYPMYPSKAEDMKAEDAKRADKINWERYLLEVNKEAVGFAVFLNSSYNFDPKKFVVTFVVKPEHHGKGYGKALYEHLLLRLESYEPTELFSRAREDHSRNMRFLNERGFKEKMRSFQSKLGVTTFDLNPYGDFEAKLKSEGIKLKSAIDLQDDANFQQKVYDLHTTLDLDVPTASEYQKPSFETFAKYHWLDDCYIPEAYFIATKGQDYIGMSENFASNADTDLHIGLTGVRKEYRRKGVALALKLKAIAFAKEAHAQKNKFANISTWNETNNSGMLSLNDALGFQKEPASIDFVKQL